MIDPCVFYRLVVLVSITNFVQGLAFVDKCPTDLTETEKASKLLGCGRDKYGNNQYICVPNVNMTNLVEFCFNGVMGTQEKGYCLKALGEQLLTKSCKMFATGCPDDHYLKKDIYMYPACQMINPEGHCYTSDPSCPPISNGMNTTHTVYNNSDSVFERKKLIENFNLVAGIIFVAAYVSAVILITILFSVIKLRKKDRL